jgi:DNA ligase 1
MDYAKLAKLYTELESTTKRLQKTVILGTFLRTLDKPGDYLALIQGKIFANWDKRKIGVADKLLLKSLSKVTGKTVNEIENEWKILGDLGEVTEKFLGHKQQATLFSRKLTVEKVKLNLEKLAEQEGAGTVEHKVQLVAELLTSASPVEGKYVLRTIIGDLRVGLGEGVMRDSIVWSHYQNELKLEFDKESNKIIFPDDNRKPWDAKVKIVQRAFNLANDFGQVAQILRDDGEEGLNRVALTPGRPIKCMLYQKAKSFDEAFETVGTPAACEFKFDGFRLQIHKDGDKIILFTRRFEDVTAQFPDVVELVKNHITAKSCILDSEAVGIDTQTGFHIAFQKISQRIKRKYNIEQLAKELPVQVSVFDLMECDGKNYLAEPLKVRATKIVEIVEKTKWIHPSEQLVTSDPEEAKKYYELALSKGYEGLMIKNLEGDYQPGNRVGFGLKVKPTMETLDLAIVGGEWGEGKRGKWISSFVVACYDKDSKTFLEVGRVATGLKEKASEGMSFGQITDLLVPHIISEKGKIVKIKPVVVIEVKYEEIQESPKYSSGYALRFPRFARLRDDKPATEANEKEYIETLYEHQRGRNQ